MAMSCNLNATTIGLLLAACACFGGTGCSSPDSTADSKNPSSETTDFSSFTGAPWDMVITDTGTCDDGESIDSTADQAWTFVQSGSKMTTGGTCPFDFSVEGDTATLANQPHCVHDISPSAEVTGGAEAFLVQVGSLTTSDGQNLTGTLTGQSNALLQMSDGSSKTINCTFAEDFVGTR